MTETKSIGGMTRTQRKKLRREARDQVAQKKARWRILKIGGLAIAAVPTILGMLSFLSSFSVSMRRPSILKTCFQPHSPSNIPVRFRSFRLRTLVLGASLLMS